MKNHRFLWLRNRTTNNRKCEKARNIKEKRTIEMFSTVSRQPVAPASSPRDEFSRMGIHKNLRCHTVFGGFRLFMWFFLDEKLCFGANPVQAKYYRNLFLYYGVYEPIQYALKRHFCDFSRVSLFV